MLINNLQKGPTDANQVGMGGVSLKVMRLKSWKVLGKNPKASRESCRLVFLSLI